MTKMPTRSDDLERKRVSAQSAFGKISKAWLLSEEQALALSGTAPETTEKDQLERLTCIISVYACLQEYFSPEIADQWVQLKNDGPLFEGERPIDTMIEGGADQIREIETYLKALLQGL